MFRKNAFSTMLAIGALLAITFAILIVSEPVQAKGEKAEVCHIPPSDPDNFHTITVNENALVAHLAHFDLGGACDGNCAALCDDGNLCTFEDTGDCANSGCPVPQPVVCGPGQVCDPEQGCITVETDECPCFTAEDLAAQGSFSLCGDFDGFPGLKGVLFDNFAVACSGPGCVDDTTSCGLSPTFTDNSAISAEQNASCQALINAYCGP